MFSFVRRHKIISGIIAVNLLVVAIIVVVFIAHNSKTASIDIAVAPNNATIEINGSKYDNFRSYDMAPGSYEAKITADGMELREISFELAEDGYYKLNTYLMPYEGLFDFYWWSAENMNTLAQVLDDSEGRVIGDNAEQDQAARELVARYRKKEAAEQNLPIKYVTDKADNGFGFINVYIRLGEEEDCQREAGTCLVISDATGGYYDMAMSMIHENGIDPEDYEIIYNTATKKERI